jgi:hypothetical protein
LLEFGEAFAVGLRPGQYGDGSKKVAPTDSQRRVFSVLIHPQHDPAPGIFRLLMTIDPNPKPVVQQTRGKVNAFCWKSFNNCEQNQQHTHACFNLGARFRRMNQD